MGPRPASQSRDAQIILHLQRAYLGAGVAAIMALVLSLGALLRLIDPKVATEGCIAIGVLLCVFCWLLATGKSLRFADPGLATAQIAAMYLLLGYLTFRSGDAQPGLSLLYMVVTLYGLLRLDAQRLIVLAAIALVLHGVAIFMLVDPGSRIDPAATWMQFGALVLGMLWAAWAAVSVSRLREGVAAAHGRLHRHAEEARGKASRDDATGAYQRSVLYESLEREASRATRTGNLLCVARVEIDRLRAVNDRFGAAAGDSALKRFADVAHRIARDVDTFGRWGGKEFLLIMPDTGYTKAIIGAERMRAAVEREAFEEVQGEWRVTCSAGLAQYRKGEDLALVLARAEAALNYAKAAGRNRVIAFDEDGKPVTPGQS
jgi:diguanylate cyclase (GGDEF)-like protein